MLFLQWQSVHVVLVADCTVALTISCLIRYASSGKAERQRQGLSNGVSCIWFTLIYIQVSLYNITLKKIWTGTYH